MSDPLRSAAPSSIRCVLLRCALARCLLARCLLARCLLARCLLARCVLIRCVLIFGAALLLPAARALPRSPIPQSPIPQSPLPQSPIPQSPFPCRAAHEVPAAPAADARAGTAVAARGPRFAVGVPGRDTVWLRIVDAATGRPASTNSPTTDPPTLRGPAPGVRFGRALSLDDSLLVVGAPLLGARGGALAYPLGAVGDLPAVGAPIDLGPAAASVGARAGTAVAHDAVLVLIGAPAHRDPTGAETGAVFPLLRPGNDRAGLGGSTAGPLSSGFTALPPLVPVDGTTEGGFGEVLALDAPLIAVGAPRGTGARSETGAVHILRIGEGGVIAPLARIHLADGLPDEGCGAALAFGEGVLAIGVPHRGSGRVALVATARLHALPAGGPVVTLLPDALLERAGAGGSALGFGSALAFGPGDAGSSVSTRTVSTIWVGAPNDPASLPLAGALTPFTRDPGAGGPAGWVEGPTLLPVPPSTGGRFGKSVAVGGGPLGALLVVGAPGDTTACGGAFGCAAGSVSLLVTGPDCDGDGVPDPCALADDPSLDADGDGALDHCRFVRGDATGDGSVDLADAIRLLDADASAGTGTPSCDAAGDVNGDRRLDIADPIALLAHLFSSGPPPPPPFPDCGGPHPEGPPCADGPCP